jgi:allophanate hydrolase subunit 2
MRFDHHRLPQLYQVKGGLDVPEYLGSQATFTLGQFGGHAGRNLLIGDMLPITEYSTQAPRHCRKHKFSFLIHGKLR